MATDLRFDVSALDKASATFVKMAAQVERLAKKIDDLDGKKATVRAEAETRKAEAQIGKFATDTRRKLEAALKALPAIEVDADSTPAQRELARVRQDMQSLADKRIGIDIDASAAIAEAKRLQGELDAIGRSSKSVQVKADTAAAMAQLAAVGAEADRLDGKRTTVKVDVDKSLTDSIVQVAALGRALGMIVMPAAALAAAPQIASIGAAAVTASGALLLLPAAGLAAAAAIATLTVGFKSFGDAIGDDPKKAAEAMAKLAPAAREAATAVQSLRPAWDALRLDVQQRLFTGLAKPIKELGGTYLPILRDQMGRIADSFNFAGQEVTRFLTSQGAVRDVSTGFKGIENAIESVSGAIAPLVRAFVDIGVVGAKVLQDITKGAGDAATRFADFIAKAKESGQLEGWMRKGWEALQQLGRIAADVGGILGTIFSAAEQSGASFLDTVERVTSGVRDFLTSAQGNQALVSFFTTIRETVDAVTPGIKALALAVADVVTKLGNAGVLQGAGAAFSSIAQAAAPLLSTLGSLAATVLPPLLAAVSALGPVLVPLAAGFLAATVAAKGMSVLSSITGHLTGFVGALRAADGPSAKFKTAITGLTGFLGGPWGALFAAAGVALTIWAGKQAEAEAKVRAHQAALEGLRSTLDQTTGAITAATVAEKASQLAKDGSIQKAQALGISSQDYTRAMLGEADAMTRVQAQLNGHTRGLVENSNAYKTLGPQLASMGVSLDDLTAAASGNQGAIDKVNGAITRMSSAGPEALAGNQMLIDSMLGAGAASGELAKQLGIDVAGFQKIQGETRLAAQAAADFGAKLNTAGAALKQYGKEAVDASGHLREGAAGSQELKTALAGVATDAMLTAQAMGDAAKAGGNVAGAGQVAADKMGQLRTSFIATAEGAGLSKTQAEALANQMGLIPSAVKTIFDTNATGAAAELITLKAQFDAVPGAKSVTVNALTTEAKGQLETLGFEVKALPDGQFEVIAKTDAAKGQLDAFMAGAAIKSATVTINGNAMPADQALTTVLGQIAAGASTVTINGQSMPAQAALAMMLGAISGGSGTVTINGQSVPAEAALSAYLNAVNTGSGTATINGQSYPADAVLQAFLGRTNSGRGTTTVYANTASAVTAVAAVIAMASRTVTMTIRSVFQNATGGLIPGYATGGIHAYAAGGIENKLPGRPFRAGTAQKFPPRALRYTGDRTSGDEFYLPDDSAAKTMALGAEWARRRGMALIPQAALSQLATATSATGPASAANLGQLGDEAARRILASLSAARSQHGMDLSWVQPMLAQLGGIRAEIAQRASSVTYAPTINNPIAETASAAAAGAARVAAELGAW